MLKDGSIKHGRVRGFKTPEEAEESYYKHLEAFENERRKFLIPKANKEIKFKDYLVYWFEEIYSKKVQSTTLMVLSFSLYEYIIPNIQYDIKLRLVTVSYVEEIINRIQLNSCSIANKARETLYLAFKDAVSENYVSTNVISRVKKYRNDKKPIVILKKEELKKLLAIVSKDNWYLEILLALFCGLRKGEILALKFPDFDIDKQTVTIQRQVAYEYKLKKESFGIEQSRQVIRDPKTKNSFRTIRVPQLIMEQLKIRKQKIDIEKKQFEDYEKEEYISIHKNGKRSGLPSLNTYLYRTSLKYGIRKISVHGLRHMFATILIEQGVSLAKISALLGHSSVHTTFDFYLDVMEEKEKISSFMNNTYTSEETYDEQSIQSKELYWL